MIESEHTGDEPTQFFHSSTSRAHPRQADAPLESAAVPGYLIQQELGRGGMGVVYLAVQDGLNRQVALKMVLSGQHASQIEKSRFLVEAEAVASIRHPGVIQVFDFGTHGGRPFFALEYLAGGSLATRLNGTPMTPADAASLVEQLSRAIHAAHTSGIVHRDLKPANILFDTDGNPKVTDFGLARRSDTVSGLTQTGAILGTPSYMSPEQAMGRHDVGVPSDVYALGAILYECLTGRPPFRAATPMETIHQVLQDEPVPPTRLTSKVPNNLETITLKCLAKDPRRRYETAKDLAEDLRRFREGEPILARPISTFEHGVHWLRRHPATTSIAATALVAIGVVVAIVISANRRLQHERDYALRAEADARQQRQLAQSRLDKAVEAVDNMLTRIASERWATRPELQEERRQVLRDAVTFYNGFINQDSSDARILTEAARAHKRLAAAYLMLNDLPRTRDAIEGALRLFQRLMAESRQNPVYVAEAAEVLTLLGNVESISGNYDQAITSFQRAIRLAEQATALDSSDENRLLKVEAQSSLGFLYLSIDRTSGLAIVEAMMPIARAIGEPSAAPYDCRLGFAFALIVEGAYDLGSRVDIALQRYDEANTILDELKPLAPPSARLSERFQYIEALVTAQRGALSGILARTPQATTEAVALMSKAVAMFDALLITNPKSFPYRVQRMQVQRVLSRIQRKLNQTESADKNLQESDRVLVELIQENPQLEWLKGIDIVGRSNDWTLQVRAGKTEDLEKRAAELIENSTPESLPHVRYNVACAYAIAASAMANAERADSLCAKAVSILNDLRESGYFNVPAQRLHLDDDADLDSLRQREDFKQFLAATRRSNNGD